MVIDPPPPARTLWGQGLPPRTLRLLDHHPRLLIAMAACCGPAPTIRRVLGVLLPLVVSRQPGTAASWLRVNPTQGGITRQDGDRPSVSGTR